MLAPIGAKTVSEGALLQFTVTASDSDIPAQTLTYSASSLPLGATFNPGTHVFSWTPASGQAGVYYNLHFEVSDGDLKDSEDITITVTSGAPPPPAVGGYALPITLDLGTSNSLFPQIGLASALSVAVAATIILVGRRKKTLNGNINHEIRFSIFQTVLKQQCKVDLSRRPQQVSGFSSS